MLKTAPDPVDVQEFQFKLRCRLKVFENVDVATFSQPCNLVTCASRFGLIFVGTNTSCLQVIQLKEIEQLTKSDGDKVDYARRTVSLPSPPKYLSVNCEHTIICVVIEKSGPCALFYDVKSFWQQNIIQLAEVRLSATPGIYVVDASWNPALSAIFTACKSDGTLGIYEIKTPGVDINELPAAAGATCFCWSPKGKQIAVGSRDGKITQYKPDLKAVKVINSPPLKEPHSLISLQWVSNYQFIGIFQPVNPNNPSCLLVIDAPKTGEPCYLNYDDICYSNGNARPFQFYMILQQNWNILMVASSNSMEVGILGNSGECWTQWTMGDAARAELPLSSNHQETLPIGLGLDIGNTQPLQWGESTLPPSPILLILSHHGVLCCFNVVNLKQGVVTICTPPDPIQDTSGLQQFVVKSETPKQDNSVKQHKAPIVQPAVELSKLVQPKTTNATVLEVQPTTTTNKPQGLNFSMTQASNLFGGQTSLIPISQGTKNNATSQPLYPTLSYQSLYPSVPSSDTSTIQPSASTINSSFTPKTVAPTTSTTTQSAANLNVVMKPKQSKVIEELAKSEIVSVDAKAEEEAETLFAQMVREECVFLESELKAVLHQGKCLKVNLGTDDDKTKIVQATKALQDFFKELVDICMTQNAEVHVLKQNLLQSWAWYEEVKSRHSASTNDAMMILLRAQPLDSASEKQLEDIRHANYYLESQIAQAHRALDEQWENFQDYCRKIHKIQIPTMEMIFQTMVKQNAILRKQNYILKDIASRIKSKSRSALGPSLLISVDDINSLPDELKRLRMNPEDVCQIQYEHVVNRTKSFTKGKSDTLRSFLKKRDYPRISAVKPQLSSTIIQPSPSTKLKSLNFSEMKKSTILSETLPSSPTVPQSTPKPVVKFELPPTTTQPSTPIEGLQNFTLKFEAKNFNKAPDKSFTPLTKSVIASSPNSAFVSTSFGSTVSTSISTASSFKPVIFSTPATANTTIKNPLNFNVMTVASSANQPIIISTSKPFSFTNTSAPSVFGQDVTNTNIAKPTVGSFFITSTVPSTVTNVTKPSFSFNLQTSNTCKTATTMPTPVFGKIETKTVVTTKPATSTFSIVVSKSSPVVTSSLNLTTNKPTTTGTETPVTISTKTTSIFGLPTASTVSSVPPFSLSTTVNTSSIFGTTDISNENTSAKPFIFSSPVVTPKTTTVVTVSTTPNRFVSNNVSTVPSTVNSQTLVTSAASDDSVKNSQSTPVAIITSKIVSQPVATTTAPVALIFGPTPTSTKPSLLGSFPATSTIQTSIFNSPVTTVSTQSSPFATNVSKPSLFATPAVSQPLNTSAVTTSSITTSATTIVTTAATTTATPIVTSAVTSTTPATTSSTLSIVFGTPTSSQPSSIFGAAVTTTTTAFSPVSTTSFIFGNTTSTKPSLFGTTPSTTKTSIFGTSSVTSSSIGFGTVTTPSTQSFAFSPKTTTSVFGTPVTPTTQSSIFGSVPASTTSQGFGMFGDATQKSSIFGTPSTSATQSSIFGNSSQPTVFGATTTTTSTPFGQSQSLFDTSKSTPSIFGPSPGFGSPSFGSTSVFGTPTATSFGQTNGSIFGTATTTTSGSIFGGTPTTSNAFGSSPVFGAPASSSSVFGSGSVFASTVTQPTAFTNTSTASFGFGSLNVGSTPTTTSSGFGATPTANPFGSENKNIFGSSSGTTTNSLFGTSSNSVFGAPSQTFGSGFGSQPVFGQQSTFGQSSFGSSTFGQQPAGPFSGGSSGTVAQSGFGAGTGFQKPGGFGGSPVFGSTPAFGSPPSFGGAPTFGSSPTFGNTSKIFGAGTTGFGASSNTQSTGFGSLANQQTVGFGNLAQQAANTPSPSTPFSGNSSFSSWR